MWTLVCAYAPIFSAAEAAAPVDVARRFRRGCKQKLRPMTCCHAVTCAICSSLFTSFLRPWQTFSQPFRSLCTSWDSTLSVMQIWVLVSTDRRSEIVLRLSQSHQELCLTSLRWSPLDDNLPLLLPVLLLQLLPQPQLPWLPQLLLQLLYIVTCACRTNIRDRSWTKLHTPSAVHDRPSRAFEGILGSVRGRGNIVALPLKIPHGPIPHGHTST